MYTGHENDWFYQALIHWDRHNALVSHGDTEWERGNPEYATQMWLDSIDALDAYHTETGIMYRDVPAWDRSDPRCIT